ncbi:MAG: hypothetical protein HY288_19985 [Planctomycetia bacterium]|nr:hypothetical protein [Planctomycetia bacterium]
MRMITTAAAVCLVACSTAWAAQIVQLPGVDVRVPAANVQVPGANVQIPGANVQIPGANAQLPGANVQIQPGGAVAPNAAINGGVLSQDPNRWRYRYHNGQWWYWLPSNSWMIWSDNQWAPYDAATYRQPYTAGYRGIIDGTANPINNLYYGGRYNRRYGTRYRP